MKQTGTIHICSTLVKLKNLSQNSLYRVHADFVKIILAPPHTVLVRFFKSVAAETWRVFEKYRVVF